MTDEEIINRVTQSTSTDAEVDEEEEEADEVEKVDQEMRQPTKEDVRRALETLQLCSLFQDNGNEIHKKVTEIGKMYELALLKQKHQLFITDFFSL